MKSKLWIGLCTGALVLSGCTTDKRPPEARFASVELQGHALDQIARVTVDVFHDNGFTVARRTYARLVFEKQASRMDNLIYGSWVAETPVWLRVKADIVLLSDDGFRLQCRPYLVRDRNETVEEELKVEFRSKPYQKMLEEVARRLSNPSAASQP